MIEWIVLSIATLIITEIYFVLFAIHTSEKEWNESNLFIWKLASLLLAVETIVFLKLLKPIYKYLMSLDWSVVLAWIGAIAIIVAVITLWLYANKALAKKIRASRRKN